LADELCSLFVNELNGKYDKKRDELTRKKKKSLTAEINSEFDEYFDDYATIKFQVTEKHTDEEIYNVLTTYQGDSLPGFPSMDAFLFLMLPKLEMLKQPSYQLLDRVYERLDSLLKNACSVVFKRFPTIEMEIFDIIQNDLRAVGYLYSRKETKPEIYCSRSSTVKKIISSPTITTTFQTTFISLSTKPSRKKNQKE
jgi:hypothetical protein